MGIFKKLFSSKKEEQANTLFNFLDGDIFYTQADGKYHIYKLLAFDKEFECCHVLCYEPVTTLPEKKDVDRLEIQIYHTPIDKKGFRYPVFLLNKRVTSNDLIGYHEYLKQTQDIHEHIKLADQYYQTGLRLTDENKHYEAIDSYSKAIDLIPIFFEAIDNRAFCKMDIGLWPDAIEDFKTSLAIKPDTLLAEFSIGECYFKMGNYQNAKRQFEKANAISPDYIGVKMYLNEINELSAIP